MLKCAFRCRAAVAKAAVRVETIEDQSTVAVELVDAIDKAVFLKTIRRKPSSMVPSVDFQEDPWLVTQFLPELDHSVKLACVVDHDDNLPFQLAAQPGKSRDLRGREWNPVQSSDTTLSLMASLSRGKLLLSDIIEEGCEVFKFGQGREDNVYARQMLLSDLKPRDFPRLTLNVSLNGSHYIWGEKGVSYLVCLDMRTKVNLERFNCIKH